MQRWHKLVALVVGVAVLAGLAAGVAMGIAAAGRRTSSTYDRFAAYADAPDLLLNFCPPDVTLENINEDVLQRCFGYDPHDERDELVPPLHVVLHWTCPDLET